MTSNLDSIVFDCSHPASLARFWCEVLDDYEVAPYDDEEIRRLAAKGVFDVEDDPSVLILPKTSGGPRIFFQKVPEEKVAKNRVHLDVRLTTRDDLQRIVALGATLVREWDDQSGYWLTDPQGNDFCVYLPAE